MDDKFMKVVLSWVRMIATAKRHAASLILSTHPITAAIAVVITLLGVGEVMSHYNWKSLKLLSFIEVEAGDMAKPPPSARDDVRFLRDLISKD